MSLQEYKTKIARANNNLFKYVVERNKSILHKANRFNLMFKYFGTMEQCSDGKFCIFEEVEDLHLQEVDRLKQKIKDTELFRKHYISRLEILLGIVFILILSTAILFISSRG